MTNASERNPFTLTRQPQEPLSDGGATLEGEGLERWREQFAPFLRYVRRRVPVLALSGGGMAMPCHVSALKVIELLGIPISRIYGTSAGAVIGGLYCAGMSTAELEQVMLGIRSPDELFGFAARHPALRLVTSEIVRAFKGRSIEQAGIYSSNRIEDYVRDVMDDYLGRVPSLGELQVPFSCIACDIGPGSRDSSRRERVAKYVFSTESTPDVSLADAIGASMSIPGTLPPKRIGERFYIDGATVEHLPVATAYEEWRSSRRFRRKKKVAIAIDLGYGGSVPSGEALSHPMDLILYSNSIQQRAISDHNLVRCHRPRQGFSVVLVRPRRLNIGICDVEKIPTAIETAYEETVRQLSGPGFLDRTRDDIRSAGAFLGMGDASRA